MIYVGRTIFEHMLHPIIQSKLQFNPFSNVTLRKSFYNKIFARKSFASRRVSQGQHRILFPLGFRWQNKEDKASFRNKIF